MHRKAKVLVVAVLEAICYGTFDHSAPKLSVYFFRTGIVASAVGDKTRKGAGITITCIFTKNCSVNLRVGITIRVKNSGAVIIAVAAGYSALHRIHRIFLFSNCDGQKYIACAFYLLNPPSSTAPVARYSCSQAHLRYLVDLHWDELQCDEPFEWKPTFQSA